MNSHIERAGIEWQPIEPPDFSEMKALHGLEFVPVPQAVVSAFGEFCLAMSIRRDELIGYSTEWPSKAVVFEPSHVLARPMTAAQVCSVNESETPKVADYCAMVQSQIAKVPILESGEPLQNLRTLLGGTASFSKHRFPTGSGEWSNKPQEFWARQSFALRLQLMSRMLEVDDLKLHFIEAFRPPGVQEAMFARRMHTTRQAHPAWSDEQVLAEAKSKTASTPRLASHKGGAAVDVWLQDEQANMLDFGHIYPDGGAIVAPRTPFLTVEQWMNRQILQVTAGLAGLTTYVGEDWHVSFGDNLASLDTNDQVRPDYVARFGPVRNFNRLTGELLDVYATEELDVTFQENQQWSLKII